MFRNPHDEQIPKLLLGFKFHEDFTEKMCKNCCRKVKAAYCIYLTILARRVSLWNIALTSLSSKDSLLSCLLYGCRAAAAWYLLVALKLLFLNLKIILQKKIFDLLLFWEVWGVSMEAGSEGWCWWWYSMELLHHLKKIVDWSNQFGNSSWW